MRFRDNIWLILIISCFTHQVSTAQEERVTIKGVVMFETHTLSNINILNLETNSGSVTNPKGAFQIDVALGDSLSFSSIGFMNRIVKVSETHLEKKSMLVYMETGLTELEEVQLIQKIRLEFSNISVDERTEFENPGPKDPDASKFVDPTAKMVGISFRSLYRSLTKGLRKKKREKQIEDQKRSLAFKEFSNKIRVDYGDAFFIDWVKISSHEIPLFLDFCISKGLNQYIDQDEIYIKDFLLKKGKEFNLIKN